MRSLLLVLAAVSALPPASAQAPVVRGGDIVVANYRPTSTLFRVTPTGQVTTLPIPAASGPSGVAATQLGEILYGDADAGTLELLAPDGTHRTVASIPGVFRVKPDIDGEFVVTSFASRSLSHVTRTGVVTPILTWSSPQRPQDVVVDENGDYIVTDDTGTRGVYRVSRTGVVTPIHVGTPLRLPQGVALFANGDYAVIDGLVDAVFRIDRATGAISQFVSNTALGNNPDGIVSAFDGGFWVSTSSINGNEVLYIDRNGNVSPPLAQGAPFDNLETLTIVPHVTGSPTVTTGPGSATRYAIDIPGAMAGTPYTIAFSLSMFPGFALPSPDTRALAVNPDGLFIATLFQSPPPAFVGFSGATDANGRATATLDLSIFAPGALAGTTLFAQGISIDLGAPTAIGQVTNPIRIDIR